MKAILTLGAKAAMKAAQPSMTFTVEVKLTRRYIWLLKLRYIWAVITAKPKRGDHVSS